MVSTPAFKAENSPGFDSQKNHILGGYKPVAVDLLQNFPNGGINKVQIN